MQRSATFSHFLSATLVVAACLCAIPSPVHSGENEDPAELLRLLEDGDFDARKSIEKRLESLGERARAALEKAAVSPSPELRQTAERLLGRLSQATLVLEVLDRKGLPVANTAVTFAFSESESGQAPFEIFEAAPDPVPEEAQRTDDSGRLVLPPRNAGEYSYSLEFKEYSFAENLPLAGSGTLLLRPGENILRVVAVPRGKFNGIVQREDGTPLHDATVVFLRAYEPVEKDVDLDAVYAETLQSANDTTQTDKEGRFESGPLDAARYHVFVKHPDFVMIVRESEPLEEGQTRELAPLKPSKPAAPLGEIRFALQNANGEPLANRGVHVQLRQRLEKDELARAVRDLRSRYYEGHFNGPSELLSHEAETDAHGVALLQQIPAGRYDVIVTDEEDEKNYYIENAKAELAPPDRPGVKPQSLGSLTGRLAARDGSGHRGFQIYALDESSAITQMMLENAELSMQVGYFLAEIAPMAQSDEAGDFTFEGLPPGRYALMVCADNSPMLLAPGHAVALGGSLQAPTLTLDHNSAGMQMVNGKVLLEDRSSAANATVYLVDAQGNSTATNTGAEGEFQLTMTAQKPLWLGVSASGASLFTQELAAGTAEGLEIVLKKTANGSLRVNVLNGAGAPLTGATLQVLPADLAHYNHVQSLTTNPRGQALFRNQRPGFYRVRARHALYGGDAEQRIEIKSGAEVECNIRFPEPARLEGRLVADAGLDPAYLARAQVVLWRRTGENSFDYEYGAQLLTPDAAGRFQSGPLPPGRYTTVVQGPGVAYSDEKSTPHELKPGETRQADIRLAPACSIRLVWPKTPGTYSATLGPAGFWEKQQTAQEGDALPVQYQNADGAPFALLKSIAPGVYDVAVTRTLRADMTSGVHCAVTRVLQKVIVTPEHASKPLELELPRPAAEQTLRVHLENQPLDELSGSAQSSSFNLSFKNGDTDVSISVPVSSLLERRRFRILGRDNLPGLQLEIPGLGTGEYTASARLEWYQPASGEVSRSETLVLPQLAAPLKLEPGRPAVTPPLRPEIPPALIQRLSRELQQRMIHVIRENMLYSAHQQPVEGFQP